MVEQLYSYQVPNAVSTLHTSLSGQSYYGSSQPHGTYILTDIPILGWCSGSLSKAGVILPELFPRFCRRPMFSMSADGVGQCDPTSDPILSAKKIVICHFLTGRLIDRFTSVVVGVV